MNNKNNTNNLIESIQTKTRVSTRSRVVVGIVTALVVITAIGTAIFFAGIIPPSGCQTQDDGTFKCSFLESFANNNNIDQTKTDAQMVVEGGRDVLKPNVLINLKRQNAPLDRNVNYTKQLCGTFCSNDTCTNDISLSQMATIIASPLTKNNVQLQEQVLNFDDAHLGQYTTLPYDLNLTARRDNGENNPNALAMIDSQTPVSAIVYNDFYGTKKPRILPISPDSEATLQLSACGEYKDNYKFPVQNSGFDIFDPTNQILDTRFIQGLTVSKNISTNLNDNYNIKSAEINLKIADIDGILLPNSPKNIKGTIILLASNDNGATWYTPSSFSNDGTNWNNISNESDNWIDKMPGKGFRYDFTNSDGNELKWAAIIQSDETGLHSQVLAQAENLQENENFENGGAADNFEIGMTGSEVFNINQNSDENPMLEKDLVPGGILVASPDATKEFYFLEKSFWPDLGPNDIDSRFEKANVTIESLTPDIVQVFDNTKENKNVSASQRVGQLSNLPLVGVSMNGKKSGFGKIRVSYIISGGIPVLVARKEFSILVIPNTYLNIDNLDISYTATKTDEVDPDGPDGPGDPNPPLPDPNDPNPNGDISGTTTYIYRGANRVIAEISGNDTDANNKLDNALDSNNLKFNYGTDKNNLDKNAKVYFDSKANKYYAVLRDLQGGEKDGFNQDGFNDGRMKYYYRFSIGDKGIFLDSEKKTTLGTFLTLNRKRTILYYYNWIFDRKYDLNKEYDFAKVQDGGVNFWYDTNITLPGIRFMMLNDRKYKEFNNYLNKKKVTKKLVTWLYKKSLDRIYDDNLYKFADDDGVNYWYRQMTKIRSRDRISREGVKFAISASTESRNELQELFAAKNEANAEFSYNVVLKRGGDQGGVNYLVDTFKDSQKRMREDLANSFEYNNRLETIEKDNGRKAAIAELYETLYSRPADVAGVDYWAESNKTIPQIKEDFLKSDEFTNVLK
ncbi:MAG: hypothetical protein WC663_01700 [Patescibacteria group bacterium]|jgi:hypothetical protein